MVFRGISWLPARPTIALFGGLGTLLARLGVLRRKVVRANIETAFGKSIDPQELRRIEAAAGGHLFMLLAETIYLAYRPASWAASCIVEIEGAEILERRKGETKGVVSFSGHFGNWEVLGAYLGANLRVSPVVKTLHSPEWQEVTENMRRKHGMTPIHVAGGATLKAALDALRNGHAVNFLMDQDMGVEGLFVPFFGTLASTPATPAALALKTGCHVYPAFIVRLGPGRHRVEIKETIDPAQFTGTRDERIVALTKRMTAEIEDMVRAHPAQYFWVHRRWRTTPEAARRRLETLAERRRKKAADKAAKAAGTELSQD